MVVNFTCQLGWTHRGQTLFWMFLWGCLWMRFTLKEVDLSKAEFLPPCGWAPAKQLMACIAQRAVSPSRRNPEQRPLRPALQHWLPAGPPPCRPTLQAWDSPASIMTMWTTPLKWISLCVHPSYWFWSLKNPDSYATINKNGWFCSLALCSQQKCCSKYSFVHW